MTPMRGSTAGGKKLEVEQAVAAVRPCGSGEADDTE